MDITKLITFAEVKMFTTVSLAIFKQSLVDLMCTIFWDVTLCSLEVVH
jgi:hypothetical protein